MKKGILILLVGLLLSTNAFAKAYKVKIKDKNKYGTVFRISLPLASDKADKWDKAFQKTIDISNKNCKKYNKKTFAFWSEHSGQYARDENGMLFPKTIAKDTWGIIQDMEPMFKVKVRYFCGENINEAYETLKNYPTYFEYPFSSTIFLGTIKYSETSQDPFKFKDLVKVAKKKDPVKVAKKAEKKEVAEKPKTNLAESIDYQATLVKYGLTLEDHTVVMEFTFNSNLTGSYVGYPKKKKKKSYSKFKYDGFNQYGETIIRFEGTSLKKKGFHTLSMKVNFDTGIVISEGFKATIVSPRKSQVIAKKPEKKPEKKKPIKKKPSPDDEKIIIIGKGSGFFINDKGHIVSNAHVVGVCKKVIAYEEGEEITLKILATDMVNDIGLVKGKFNNKQYLNIKTDGAELGEQIVVFGYPLSQELSDSVKLTQGIVSSLSGPDNNYSEIQIDAAIQQGNSGGPVVNMNGQVVGIASAGLSKLYMLQKADYIPENVNFAVAAQSLTTFLKANKMKVTSGPTRIYSTKELAKIGEPATIQLICMNTMAEYEKLKKSNKHSDMLLDLQ